MNTCNSANCGTYKCNPENTTCLTNCKVDSDCAQGNTCNSGACYDKSLGVGGILLIIGAVILSIIIGGISIYFAIQQYRADRAY